MTVSTTVSSEAYVDDATKLSDRNKSLIMAGVLLGLFLEALDQTIVATALPAIVAQFQGIDLLAWVSTTYLLASTALLPVYGKLSDILGRRIIVVWSIIMFLIGSVLCGFANSMVQLAVFRLIQGIGAAGLGSTALAIPADLYPPAERARATGLIGAVFGISSILGPFVGGFLTDTFSWRWIFFVNVPFGLIALTLIIAKMPKLNNGRRDSIDWWGTGLLLVAVTSLLLGLSLNKQVYPWTSPLSISLFIVAAVSTSLLVWVEKHVPSPIIPLHFFRNRTFMIMIVLATLMGLAFLPTVLFLPLFLVNVVGMSATGAGMAMIPQTLALVTSAILGANILQRLGRYKPILLFSLLLALVGYVLLGLMTATSSLWDVIWRIALLGFGLGGVFPLLTLVVQNALPHRHAGMATANVQFFQQIGSVLGAVVFGTILSGLLTTHFESHVAPALNELPPSVQQRIDISSLRSGGFASDGGGQVFDLEMEITQAVEADTASGSNLSSEAKTVAVQQAQVVGQNVQVAARQAFATSITHIYRYVIAVIGLGFVVTLALQEIPLRTSNAEELEE